jgi:hypothetical protein
MPFTGQKITIANGKLNVHQRRPHRDGSDDAGRSRRKPRFCLSTTFLR